MLATQAPLISAEAAAYPEWLHASMSAYLGVPILVRGKVMGFLQLASITPGYFTARHAEQLRAFANHAAVAIENAQLYDKLLGYTSHLEQRVAERTAELNQEKERVEAILNSTNDAIVVTDVDGLIRQTNPSFRNLFAYQLGGAVGQASALLTAPQHAARLVLTLTEGMAPLP